MKQLGELQSIESDLRELGYGIAVVAPDLPLELRKTRTQLQLTLPLYSDASLTSAVSLGIAFEQTDDRYFPLLERHSGMDHHRLPVPAVLLVDAERRILFSYVNPDYKVRIPSALVLEAARAFASQE